MKKLLKYMHPNWLMAIIGALAKFVEATIELIFPLIMALIIDNGILGQDRTYIVRFSTILLILAIIGTFVAVIGQYSAAKAAHGMGKNIRNDLYSHINHLSSKEINKFDKASLINRVNDDTHLVERAVALFIRLALRCPIIAIGAIIMTLRLDVPLSLVLITILPIVTVLVIIMITQSVRLQINSQKRLDNISKNVKQNMSGLRVIKSLNNSDIEKNEFLDDNDSWKKLGIASTKKAGSLPLFTNLILHIGISLVIFMGARRIYDDIITPGTLIAFISYVNIIVTALLLFTHLAASFSKGFASSKRINEVLEMTSSITYGNKNTFKYNDKNPLLEINNIKFSYGKKASLDLDKVIKLYQGQTLGVIGATGSGKSTLAKLLTRNIDSIDGKILLNGININEYTNETLRKHISIASQNGNLLNKSIKDNINMNNDFNDDKIIDILKISQAYDFVKEKSEFLDYIINEETTNLSGGQKQRLIIARALAVNPSILILDDSFSALDYQTDYNLRQSLINNFPNMSKIIITQRVNTIKDCDSIIVLDHGKLISYGTHNELISTCDIYKEINSSQTKEGM